MDEVLVLPEDLTAFAWSAPMRDLAARLGLSDAGLKKILARCGVASPPQGYWNKVRAGKTVPAQPKPRPRQPGGMGRLKVDARFAKAVPVALPLPGAGPFASAMVPEDLDELYARELKAIGKVSISQTLDRPHRGLVQMLKREQRRHEKVAQSQWAFDRPRLDSPLDKRRLRILNALFLALSKRGHDGDAYEQYGQIEGRAEIGDTYLGLIIDIVGSRRTPGEQAHIRSKTDLPISTPLVLKVDPDFDGKNTTSWRDDKDGTLETKLAEITAAIIVAGEKKFRDSVRQADERAKREQLEKEQRRQERLNQLSQERLQNLRKSGELLRQAEDIRALVQSVRHAIEEGSHAISASTLEAWQKWALEEADRIDPVRSGQIFTHLDEPSEK